MMHSEDDDDVELPPQRPVADASHWGRRSTKDLIKDLLGTLDREFGRDIDATLAKERENLMSLCHDARYLMEKCCMEWIMEPEVSPSTVMATALKNLGFSITGGTLTAPADPRHIMEHLQRVEEDIDYLVARMKGAFVKTLTVSYIADELERLQSREAREGPIQMHTDHGQSYDSR
eukprot:44681-Eustigmatos_ZCMA.PRE.2